MGVNADVAGLRILVAEDEFIIAMMIEDTLTRLGCEVVGPMTSLEKGLEALATERLDGALLDVNLRGEQVYPLADALVARGVPIAFVTGYGEAGLARRFIGTPVVNKPFSLVTLERIVAQHMAGRT